MVQIPIGLSSGAGGRVGEFKYVMNAFKFSLTADNSFSVTLVFISKVEHMGRERKMPPVTERIWQNRLINLPGACFNLSCFEM